MATYPYTGSKVAGDQQGSGAHARGGGTGKDRGEQRSRQAGKRKHRGPAQRARTTGGRPTSPEGAIRGGPGGPRGREGATDPSQAGAGAAAGRWKGGGP